MSVLNLINGPIGQVIDEVVSDKVVRDRLKQELREAALNQDSEFMMAASSIIVPEAPRESAAQRNWRPYLMYLFMALLLWAGVIVPLLVAFAGVSIPVQDSLNAIPSQNWTMLTMVLGGYIVGRTAEKLVKAWKKN